VTGTPHLSLIKWPAAMSCCRVPKPTTAGPLIVRPLRSEGSQSHDAPTQGWPDDDDPNRNLRYGSHREISRLAIRYDKGPQAAFPLLRGLVVCLNTERARRDSNPQPSDP